MKIFKLIIRITALLLMVVLGFTIVMPGWYHQFDIIKTEVTNRFKTNAQLVQEENARYEQEQFSYLAKAHNLSEEEFSQLQEKSRANFYRKEILLKLAKSNQAKPLVSIILGTSQSDIPISIFAAAISTQSRDSFTALLKQELNCDYDSPWGHQAFEAAVKAEDAWYFEQMIANGCKSYSKSSKLPLAKILLSREKFDLMLSLPIRAESQPYFDRAFSKLIANRDAQQAINFLRHGVSKNQLDKSLIKVVRYGFSSLARAMLDKGADYSVPESVGLNASVLNASLQQQDLIFAREILSKDPQYISRETKGDDSLFYSVIHNFEDESARNEALHFLTTHGVNPQNFPRQGFYSLMEAIKLSQPKTLQFLIDNGANPKLLYKSESLIEFVESFHGHPKQELNIVLERAGVTKDGVEMAKNSSDFDAYRRCEFDSTDFDFHQAAIDVKKSISIQQINKLTGIARCETMLLSCTKSQNRLDTCIQSVPTCTTKPQDAQFSELFCCESTFKARYAKARCAGLPPEQAVLRIPNISTAYGIPIILINESLNEKVIDSP